MKNQPQPLTKLATRLLERFADDPALDMDLEGASVDPAIDMDLGLGNEPDLGGDLDPMDAEIEGGNPSAGMGSRPGSFGGPRGGPMPAPAAPPVKAPPAPYTPTTPSPAAPPAPGGPAPGRRPNPFRRREINPGEEPRPKGGDDSAFAMGEAKCGKCGCKVPFEGAKHECCDDDKDDLKESVADKLRNWGK